VNGSPSISLSPTNQKQRQGKAIPWKNIEASYPKQFRVKEEKKQFVLYWLFYFMWLSNKGFCLQRSVVSVFFLVVSG
jgi:hypothetical protein